MLVKVKKMRVVKSTDKAYGVKNEQQFGKLDQNKQRIDLIWFSKSNTEIENLATTFGQSYSNYVTKVQDWVLHQDNLLHIKEDGQSTPAPAAPAVPTTQSQVSHPITQVSIVDPTKALVKITGLPKEAKRKLYPRKTGKLADWSLFNYHCTIYGFHNKSIKNQLVDGWDIVKLGTYESGANVAQIMNSLDSTDPSTDPIVDWTQPVQHKEFETIKACVEEDIPVYLYGPAGSGKNFVLQSLATELGLDFYFTNSIQQEFKVTGFIDAGGNFHETEFFKAFKNGGLFFLDEMDASIPEVLVLLNAAIANRYFEFPNGRINAHEDFRVVAAGNTIGRGANKAYTGRLTLDQATLDRFVAIEFDYDQNIEMAITKGNTELVTFVRRLRDESEKLGIVTTFSYRCMMAISQLESKLDLQKALTIALLKGMDIDTARTLKSHAYGNKYETAFNQLIA